MDRLASPRSPAPADGPWRHTAQYSPGDAEASHELDRAVS